MTTLAARQRDPATADDLEVPGGTRATLWLSELVVGGLVLAVALLAWVSLILADTGHHRLVTVVPLTLAAIGVVAFVMVRFGGRRASVRVDRVGMAGVVLLAAFAAVLFLPGFHYGASDKDPGGYVDHAMEIARTGSYQFVDPASEPGRIPAVALASPNSRFPAVWLKPGTDVVVPQFYHLWPALMATSYDVAGEPGLSNTAPLCGILAVLALALAVRRAVAMGAATHPFLRERAEAAGLLAGGVAGGLLASNMLEVWQAKYPTTEITAQLFFAGTLLGIIVALGTRWRPAAGAAGMFLAIGFLDRADNLVLLLLAAVLGAALVALRRFDGRAMWFAGGVAIVLPHALWQAYSLDAARRYTLANQVPGLTTVAVVVVVLFGAGVLLRYVRPLTRTVERFLTAGRAQTVLGMAVFGVSAALVALGFLRPRLFGADYADFGNGVPQRTYDEQALDRLAWFLSLPAFGIMLLGVGVVAVRRWNAALWTLLAPLLILLPIYAYHARNSTRLMWWTRRYVSTVLPGFLALVGVVLGLALVAFLAHRWSLRLLIGVPALAATLALSGYFLQESLPLRHHDEMGGSFAVTARLAALSDGADGVYLWPSQPCCLTETALFPGALWLGRGQLSALLPPSQQAWPSYVSSFEQGFPGSPVFVIAHGADAPGIPGVTLTRADHIVTSLPYWEEADSHRPDHSLRIPVDFSVWRVAGT